MKDIIGTLIIMMFCIIASARQALFEDKGNVSSINNKLLKPGNAPEDRVGKIRSTRQLFNSN